MGGAGGYKKNGENQPEAIGEIASDEVVRALISARFNIPFWLVDKLPYSFYLQMKRQAVNLGNWANGNKLDLGGVGSGDDVESDFMRRIKQGDVSWMCQHCLKRKERDKPCECEKESLSETSTKIVI